MTGTKFPLVVFTSVNDSTDLYLRDNGVIELLSDFLQQ